MKLSIIIPAFNEERRLPNTLNRIVQYLRVHFKETFEIIVVSDGSTDGTVVLVENFKRTTAPEVSLVSYPDNRGRGVAVRLGIAAATGEYILETDADGSVDEEAIVRFVQFFDTHSEVQALIGSRNVSGAEILTHQSWWRVFLGNIFLCLAKALFGHFITDYTLGFKMFRRAAARDIFEHQYDNRYLAEAEIVYVAHQRGWRLQELPVRWTDYRNSKVQPLRDSVRSLVGLGKIFQRKYAGRYAKDLPLSAIQTQTPPRGNFRQRLHAHAFIIITGLMLTALVSFSQIIFPYVAGNDYRGINIPHFGSDGHNYIARGKEVLEGHKLGNVAFREGKEDGQDWHFTMNEYVLMAPIRLLGLALRVNVVTVYNLYNFIGVFVVILLIYFLVRQLSGDNFLSAATALFVVGGYSIIYSKTFFYTDFNIYGRPTFPYVSSLGFFIYLNLLIKSLRVNQRRYIIYSGLALGWLFYSYFYAWTFALALTVILLLLYVIARDFARAKQVFIAGAVGVALGLYNVIKLLFYFRTPAGKQLSYFLWSTHGYQPIFSKIGFITLLLLALYVYRRRRDQNIIIIGAFILAGWVALNQQLLTGQMVQYGHYYWFFIVPLSIIVSFYMVWWLLRSERARLLVFSLFIVGVFVNTAVGQWRSFWTTSDNKLYEQKYRSLIDALASADRPGVILTTNDTTAYLFTIYTSHDLFWHSVGTVHTTPLQRFKDALFVYSYLNKLSRHNFFGYLTSELGQLDRLSLSRDIYTNLEGYWSGLDFYAYMSKLRQSDPAILKKRTEILQTLAAEYDQLAQDSGKILNLLRAYKVEYIVWDKNKHPEWDLAFIPNLERVVDAGPIQLYKIALP